MYVYNFCDDKFHGNFYFIVSLLTANFVQFQYHEQY